MSLRNAPRGWGWMRRQWAAGGPPAGDTEAPTKPGLMSASAITETTLTLTWGASTDNVDVINYRVEQAVGAGAFAWLATVAAPTVTLDVTGLTASAAYRFRVLAADAAGNQSAWEPGADGLSVTTASAFSFTDPTFNDGTVYAIIDDGSGGRYVGGSFTSVTCNVNATTYTTGYTRLIHLLPTGEVDAAWSCPASSIVYALTLDSANDVLFVGGQFAGASGLGGSARDRLGAVTASTGIVDAGWVCNASSTVLALALDSANDRLFVGGGFNGASGLGGSARNRLGAVTASTGIVDAGWVCDASSIVRALALDSANDALFVGGSFNGASGLGGAARAYLGAVTASTGVVDAGWACNASSVVYALALDSANDALFVGGLFSGASGLGGSARDRLGAVTASTGVVDAGWVCDASLVVYALALDSANDALYVGGDFNGATGLDGQQRDRFGTVVASTGDLFIP